MSAVPPAQVSVETGIRLVTPDATALPLRATFRYHTEDPYAVRIIFHPDGAGATPVTWVFARELLVTGLDEPTGLCDVRVWPWASPRGDFTALAVSSPDGNALYEIPKSVLVRFLRRTYAAVPRGHESEFQEPALEAAVARFVTGNFKKS